MATKLCKVCGYQIPLEDFYRNGPRYFHPQCKKCHRNIDATRRTARKLSDDPVPPPLGSRPCDICRKTPKDARLQFDHAHERYRGWLCKNCNQFTCRNDVTVSDLKRAIEYIITHDAKYATCTINATTQSTVPATAVQ